MENISTFSIVAVDLKNGDIGCAVASKAFAVGSIVPWLEADVGGVATQALANTSFGPRGLELAKRERSAEKIVKILLGSDGGCEDRQVGITLSSGDSFAFTGNKCKPHAGHKLGKGYSIQGNFLRDLKVVDEMEMSFLNSEGPLYKRLLAAMLAGEAAGGDNRGKQSAAIVIHRIKGGYRGHNDRYMDIRVDDHIQPLNELMRLIAVWEGLQNS